MDAERVLSMNVIPKMPSDLRRPWYRYVQWSDELIARLEATPGIEAAAVSSQVPLTSSFCVDTRTGPRQGSRPTWHAGRQSSTT